ncbi:MAG: SusC/RagA family TonB-linked outer membrane protein [Sphingobacteriia bacterium]|nr:SusC/RagA family TonB-linked outer membrane protein [Sphingobacteriia bacterium]
MHSTAFGHQINFGPFTQMLRIMKMSALLVLLVLQAAAHPNAIAQVTLKEKAAPLEKVLKAIKKQSAYGLVFDETLVRAKGRPVSIEVSDRPVEEVLAQIFRGQDQLTYTLNGRIISVKERSVGKLPAATKAAEANEPPQPITVRGRVVNEKGEAAVGVAVMIKGTTRGTSTNERGEFSLSGVPENAMLVFSSVNLERFEMKVTADKAADLSITLKAKISELADITISSVNTGYQTISKERVNGSYYAMDSTAFNRRVSTDVISRLEGMVPGLLFNRNVSGTGLNLSIRGHSTILANDQPLIVVDNFPYDGSIDNINPNDVESITVLKDASAASIWGAKSGNGVIVITTKKGRRYQPLIMELNSNVTIGSKPDLFYSPKFIASSDFINVEKTLFGMGYYDANLANSGKPAVSPVVKILARQRAGQITTDQANQQIDALRQNDIRNDLNKYLLQKSVSQRYSLNIRGGGLSSDYFLSFGFDNNRSSNVANSNKRVTITGISNFYPTKNLTLSAAVYYVQSNNLANDVSINSINPLNRPVTYPYAQLVDAGGRPVNIDKDFSSFYTDTVGTGKLMSWRYSPLEEIAQNYDKTNLIDNRINLAVRYNFLNGFGVEGKFQYQKSSSSNKDYSGDSSYAVRYLYNRYTNLSTGAHPVPAGGILGLSNRNLVSYRSRFQLNYNHTWAMHSVNLLAGAEINSTTAESSNNTLYGYNEDLGTFQYIDLVTVFPTIPTGSNRVPFSSGISQTNDRFLSYYSNASYLINGKYSLTASARIDKSNLFGVNTNQKAIPLYSIGAGWEFSKEKWLNLAWLDAGKLRVTYGYNGNINKSVAAITTFTSLASSTLNRIPYATLSNPGNPELRWERISMVNFGMDFSVLKNRITGSIEYYRKKGTDLFGQAPLPGSSGLTSLTGNFANTKGYGVDILIRSVNVRSKNILWTTDFIFSKAKDVVTKYGVKAAVSNYLLQGDNNGTGANIPLEGKPLFAIYSYPFAGLDNNGDPLGYYNGKPSNNWAGIIGNTTTDSMLFHGSSRPTVFGSLRNTISYKGFTLSFNLLYKFGYYFRRSTLGAASLFGSWIGHEDYYSRWQKPGDENYTDVPALQYPPINNNRGTFYSNSSALVEKGDHIRLQDINLSYQFNNKVLKSIGLNDLQVYSYLNNIGLVWRANKSHLDPDIYGDYRIPLSIAFGIKATF